MEKNLRLCSEGHSYYKSSDCPTCPFCEKQKAPKSGFLSLLSAPARRALEHEDITTLEKLSEKTEKEILKLHGMGPKSLPIMRRVLEDAGLKFKK